jgi:hypothetical protein
MRPLLSKALPTALIHGPEITVSLNPAGTLAGKRFLPKRRPHASTAKPAMARSRLIPENKAWTLILEGLVHITRNRHRRRFLTWFIRELRGEVRENVEQVEDLYRAKDNPCCEPSRYHSKLSSDQALRRSSFVQKNWGSICCVCIKYSNCLRRVNVLCSKTSFVMSIRLNRS